MSGRPAQPSETAMRLAEGEAALMLVESLMLALVERRLLSPDQVIEAIETVIETKRAMAEDGSHPEISSAAAGLAGTIANSVAALRPPPARGDGDATRER